MIINKGDINKEKDFYDYCIVGTGPAGFTLALTLEASGKKILMLEGGKDHYTQESQDIYKGQVIGDKYFDLDAARLRYFGGTSNHWGGWCRNLDEEDFLAKKGHPITEWPIRKNDLDPYLNKASSILNLNNIRNDIIFEEDGIKEIDFVYSKPVVRFGQEKYKDYISKSKNIFLVLNANVLSIHTNGKTVDYLNVVDEDRWQTKLSARIYILATGGIENSRILLWSNELSNGQLIKNNETLGKYWMEHPVFTVGEAFLTGDHAFKLLKHGRVFFSPTKETIERFKILNCGLRLMPNAYSNDTKKILADIACIAPKIGKWAAHLFNKKLLCGARLDAQWEQVPRKENRIELSSEKDALGMPRVKLYWKKNDDDLRTLRTTSEVFGKYLAKNDIGRLRLKDWVLGKVDYPADDELAAYHHMGGTRMASSSTNGVVDGNCKVFGQNNLYIAGSSVFPSTGHCNPTLTIVQLAIRLGDHLLSINKQQNLA